MAGNTLGRAVVDFGANTATLQTDMSRAVGIVDKAVADINVTINKAGSGANFNGVSSQVKSLESDFQRLQGVISGVFGVGIGVAAIKQVMDLADEYQNVSNRIQTVTVNAQDLARVQAQVFKVAQDTGAALDDTAKMYQRLEQSIQGSGKSQAEAQQQAIALTKTLNEEIVVSGASAGEASRAIMDLVHGLSGGVLHAQQLRPIMRQMPDLAKQIAAGLGLSAKQFEELVHKGLPAVDVLKALDAQAASIDAKFNALPKTFARAWQELHNAVEQYVGQASQASAVSDGLKSAIVGIANNIGAVATGAEAVGIAMGTWLGGKALQSLSAMALGLRDAVTAQGAYKTAAILSAEADVATAAAQRAALAATIANTDARNDLRIAEINGLNSTAAALTSEIAALERESVAGQNVLATTERLIAARQELAVVTARTAETEGAMAAAQAKATLAENEETAATIRLAESKAALVAAQTEATAATGLFARAGAGLFAAIGGWPTVVLAAAVGVYYLATAEDDLDKKNDELVKSLKAVEDAHGTLTPAMQKTAEAAFAEAQAVQETIKAQLAAAQSEQDAAVGAYDMGGGFGDAQVKAGILSGQLQTATTAAQGLAKAFTLAKIASVGNWLTSIFNPSSTDNMKALLVELQAGQGAIDKQTETLHLRNLEFGKTHVQVLQAIEDEKLAKSGLTAGTQAYNDYRAAIVAQNADLMKEAQIEDQNAASKKSNTQALRDQRKELTAQQAAQKRYTEDVSRLTNLEEQLSSGLSGPYLAALKTYQKGIDLTAKTWQDAVDAGTASDDLINQLSDDQELLAKQLNLTNAQIKSQHDLFAAQTNEMNALLAVQGIAPKYQAAITDGLKKYDDLIKSHYDFYGTYIDDEEKLKKALDDQLPTYVKNQQAIQDLAEQQRKATQLWGDFADAIFDATTKSGGFLKNLLANLKDIVTQMLKEWFRTRVIGYFTGGGGGGGYGGLISAGVSAVSGGGGSSDTFSAGGDQAGNVTGGSGTGLFSASGWVSTGKKIYDGFSSAFTSNGISVFGGNPYVEGSANFVGPPSGSAAAGAGYGGYGSQFGQALGVAGGVYAGYNRFADSNKDAGGALGGVAYGVGTYYAGAALATGATAAAAGGLTAGAAAGMAAIPVIGWIALAAILVDQLSGGKLFGTKGKLDSSSSTLSVGADNAAYTQSYTLKGQKAFFGGAKFSTHEIDPSPEAKAAAAAFYDALKKDQDQFAKAFNVTAGDMISGAFTEVFDKNGKSKSTTSVVGGRTYTGETQEQFGQRLVDENRLAILDTFDSKLNASIDVYRASVDGLTQVTQGLAIAQSAFQAGAKMLALNGNDTLSAMLKLAEGVQASGETIDQTIQRLIQAQAQYDQFVAQFKPAATYASGFQQALAQINAQMKANAAQANLLAKAAGAEHASTQDLINIHNAAAQAFVAAVQVLQNQTQSLAASLGYALPTSLDEINAAIAALEGKANAGTDAVSSFGGAMNDAAQRATDAINLLLGDLSPLNDQQKLQTALQGQMAGTVTPTQVLEIARRLMGSGSDYAHIFAQVQAIGDRTQRNSGAGNTGGSSNASTGLTFEESQQLKELKARQAQAVAQGRHTDALQLAQNIADLVGSTGESIQAALDNLGIKDIGPFMKDLGVTDRAAFDKLITDLESKKDSAGESTDDLAKEITSGNSILSTILDVVIDFTHSTRTNPSSTSQAAAGPLTEAAHPRGTRGNGLTPAHLR